MRVFSALIGGMLAGLLGAAAPALAEGCPQPAELGQVVLPPAPCYDITVTLDGPTNRYPHGILGDTVEYSQMKLTSGLSTATNRLPVTRVFEDLGPRLADVDGLPGPEIIVVESDERGGSSLAIHKPVTRGQVAIRWVASTRPIGQRFRWLAPVGIADFDGDGQNDIAYVETPHLDKVLRIVTLRDGKLVELAAGAGFSNHRIGDNFITGGVADCGRGPEIITPSADWSRVLAARLEEGILKARLVSDLVGPESVAQALACETPG